MMMDNTLLISAMAMALSALFPVLLRLFRRIEERRDDERSSYLQLLTAKLEAGLKLDSKEVLDVARGAGIGPSSAIQVVYELYARETEEERCQQLRAILDDFARTEPFESYPDEVKPSMAILSKICSEAADDGTRSALIPIQKTIENYQQLQRDHEKSRALNKNSFVVAVVSFLIGIAGLVLAFRSPSAGDIEKSIREVIKSEMIQNPQQDASHGPGTAGAEPGQ